jgi:hypothetical protein
MATQTSVELPAGFDWSNEGGLDEFEPEPGSKSEPEARDSEAQHSSVWQRVENPAIVDVPRPPVAARPPRRGWLLVVPVVLAAAIAGGVMSWLGMRTRVANVPSAPRPVATSEASGTSEVPRLEPPATSNAAAEAPPIAAPQAPAETVPAPPVRETLDPAFERTLTSVSDSYRTLDAASLSAVWPGADTESLSRLFAGLKYQSLSFDHCAVRPQGSTGAVASCDVTLAMAPKSGDPSLQRRHESWTLALDRAGERWTIVGVSVR